MRRCADEVCQAFFLSLVGEGSNFKTTVADTVDTMLIVGNSTRIHLTGNSLLLGYCMRRDANSAVDAHFCLLIQT